MRMCSTPGGVGIQSKISMNGMYPNNTTCTFDTRAVVNGKEDEEEVKNILGTQCVPVLCVAVEKTGR